LSQVFVSYKREQIEFAQSFESKLKGAGFDVWMDRDIRVGTEWREIIDEEIRKSIAVIVIMTQEAKGSEYVTYEWAFANGAGVRVIPIIYIKPEELHPRLKTLQYLDHEDPKLWDRLIHSLQDAKTSFLTIHSAVWGVKDQMKNVTSIVQHNLLEGKHEIQAHKMVFGDPSRGNRKKLVVVYSYGGMVTSEELDENDKLILPK